MPKSICSLQGLEPAWVRWTWLIAASDSSVASAGLRGKIAAQADLSRPETNVLFPPLSLFLKPAFV